MLEYWGLPIIIGMTIIGVLLYLLKISNRFQQTLDTLYTVNQKIEQDALIFIDEAWPILASMGISGLQAKIDWFGENISYQHGTEKKHSITHHINDGELSADLTFFTATLRGEKKLVIDLLIHTFILILSANFSAKHLQVRQSQEQLTRQRLFAEHDLKNLVQFLILFDEQLRDTETAEEKLALLEYTKSMMPVVMARADRLNPKNETPALKTQNHQQIKIKPWLENLADAMHVQLELSGDATYNGPKNVLDEAFKNILENFKLHQQPTCPIKADIVYADDWIEISLNATKSAEFKLPPAERIFEPFYTTSDSGLGLGLYLTRTVLKDIKSTIHLTQTEKTYGFKVRINQQE